MKKITFIGLVLVLAIFCSGCVSWRAQADARTCMFHKKDGKWHGGFYEWISTSRTTRNWANIKGKYKGWKWEEIPNGAEAAFVIISKDEKKRTNVLKETWKK